MALEKEDLTVTTTRLSIKVSRLIDFCCILTHILLYTLESLVIFFVLFFGMVFFRDSFGQTPLITLIIVLALITSLLVILNKKISKALMQFFYG
ncbi:hypothetical protein DID77_00190 [Candidatus Marinamargulisbacteria bacterium SCGC AG-439-L15]|nr:hypothetical protein DID77_00190 [Candidatus Marinamargulisbacteria bacterium SCGC AG-439-L15]